MSGDERSREALNKSQIKKLEYDLRGSDTNTLPDYIVLNADLLVDAPEELLVQIELKWNRMFPGKELPPEWERVRKRAAERTQDQEQKVKVLVDEKKAPEFVKKLSTSDPPRPPESGDVKYLDQMEVSLDRRINTLEIMLVEDPEAPDPHPGPFILRCIGRDREDGRMMVVRLKAKAVPIEPWMVMQYLGSVIMDHQSVHTNNVVLGKRRHGYCFDRFYIDPRNGKRYERCCLITDRVHQAGLMYEKIIDKRTRKALARIRRQRGPMNQFIDDPMYRVIGASEGDYRDLKRLFERHFLKRGDEELADDIGLKLLIGGK